MSRKIKWGILSTAKIGVEKVIPAMQKAGNLEITGIASRDLDSAENIAGKLGIKKSYGSYDDLLNDPDIEAIYNPLPNHLHFEWTKKAIEKGKHILCEKPLTLIKEEITELINLRDQHQVKVGEAFMVDSHPQWLEAARIVKAGELGKIKAIQGFFSYHLLDPENIRNRVECGGGAMWDIGCYPVHVSRFVLDKEPQRVMSLINRDPQMQTDRLTSVIMEFPACQCNFTVSTQLVPHQKMIFFGDRKKLEIEIPFNAPNDRECKIFIDDGDLTQVNRKEISFDICDQYTLQGERFSQAILDNTEVPTTLEDAYQTCAIIEAIFSSEKEMNWVQIDR